MDCTAKVLDGTYEYPKGMDHHTKLLLYEAHFIFSQMSEEEIIDFVTTQDFQEYWQNADENIQSSESGIQFGHNKATIFDRYLSSLPVAKLTLAVRTGTPLAWWGNGLIVLLEKVFGNIFINKMRAICLLEADYNWLNKLVFATRMMDKAYDKGIVPAEQFARRGVQAAEGVLVPGLFCDIDRAMHWTAGLQNVDLRNRYDAVAHTICEHCVAKL